MPEESGRRATSRLNTIRQKRIKSKRKILKEVKNIYII